MFWRIFLFELTYRLRASSTWICFIVLTAMVYREMLAGQWDDLIASGRVARNSPYAIYYVFMYYTFWTATLGAGLVIQSILRDLRTRSGAVVYSYPVGSQAYFWGKYAGALLILVLVASSVVAGFILMPWLATTFGLKPADQFISTSWAHIGHAYAVWTLPGCFIYASIFFALAAATGRAGPAYAAMATFLGLFVMLAVTFGEAERALYPIVQVLDPLGKATLESQIYFWSADERMSRFLSLEGDLLRNRLLFVGLAAAAMAVVASRFDLRALLGKAIRRQALVPANSAPAASAAQAVTGHRDRTVTARGSTRHFVMLGLAGGWQEFALTTRETHFRIAVGATLLLVFGAAWGSSVYTPPEGAMLPVAFELLRETSVVAALLCLVAVAFYAAEIAGRERTVRIAPLVDACPAPSWTLMASKVIGALLVALLFAVIPTAAALVILAVERFSEPNPALYWQVTALWLLPSTIIYALTALTCYALTHNKIAAQALAILVSVTAYIFEELHTFEHPLIVWSTPFRIALSDFDLGGQSLVRGLSFSVYWLSLFSLFGIVLAYWLWPRGEAHSARQRFARVQSRLRAGSASLAMVLLCGVLASGGYIYYTMNVRNHYHSDLENKLDDAEYEKTYAALRSVAQPKVMSAQLAVDLYPDEQRAEYVADLGVENRTLDPISALHLEPMEFSELRSVSVSGRVIEPSHADTELRHFVYPLSEPLVPDAQATLRLAGHVQYVGFADEPLHGTLFADVSYVPSEVWPKFGYDRTRELILTGDRKEAALGARAGLPSADRAAAVSELSLAYDKDRASDGRHLTITTSITTDADQFALAPGELVRDLRQGDRRTFVYRSDPPQLWDPHMISGRFAVRRGVWTRGDGSQSVAIEVYFNPRHSHNVERFLEAAKLALAQGSRLWGPYPYRSLRIAEAPKDVVSLATHHSTTDFHPTTIVTSGNLTVIPEDKGWVNDYRTAPTVDWITYVVAREVSRAWWGQSVRPVNTTGTVLINEGIPALHGLLALEKRHGIEAARHYVDVLTESYLRLSTREDQGERPILAADQQGYPPDRTYMPDKAALALHQLYRALGRNEFMETLWEYHAATHLQPASVTDLATRIMVSARSPLAEDVAREALSGTALFDYRVKEATAGPLNDGRYRLNVAIECMRFASHEQVDRRAEPADGPVQIAVIEAAQPGPPAPPLLAECRNGRASLDVVLPGRPQRVEVDPARLRIDRNLKDNGHPVVLAAATSN